MALSASNGGGFAAGDLSESGLAQLPIFNVEPVQLAFSIAADFVAAQVANNVLILALSTGRILRIDLERPEDIDGTPHAPGIAGPDQDLWNGVSMAGDGTTLMLSLLQTSTFPKGHPKQVSFAACSSIRQPRT